MFRAAYRRRPRDQGMQERNASQGPAAPRLTRARPAAGLLEHVVRLGPQFVLDGLERLAHRRQRSRFALDQPADSVGCVPQVLARELQRDPRRRAGGRAGEGRDVDAGTWAPRRHVGAQRRAVPDAERELGDHGGRGHAEAAHVHADADTAEVLADPRRRQVDRAAPSRGTPGAGPVVAQVGCGGGRREPAGRSRLEEAAAGRQADVGVGGVLPDVAEAPEVLPGCEGTRGTAPLRAQADAVGDGGAGGERGDGVVGARGVEDEGVGRVGDEERGVVRLLVRGVGHAALAARLEEPGHDVDRLRCTPGALEAQADEIHADQGRLRRAGIVCRADTLVSDGDAVLVDTVLGAPEPGGARQEGGVRSGVADREVLRAQRAAGRGCAGRRARRPAPRPVGGPSSWRTPCRPAPGRTACRTWSQCREGGYRWTTWNRAPSSPPTRSTSPTWSSGPAPGTNARERSRRCGASAPCPSSRSPRSPRHSPM